MKKYRVNEIFYSLQGEGARAGSANCFVRLSGCNLQCSKDGPEGFDCDTEFSSGVWMTADEILTEMQRLSPACRNTILTGGEPSLQVDTALVEALKFHGRYLCIETNGTNPLPSGIDWISCSPKTAEHTLRVGRVNELRYVRHRGQGVPAPLIEADQYFISPAAQPSGAFLSEDIEWCAALVREHPAWRLSVQQHKLWRVR